MADVDGLLGLWTSSFDEMRPDVGTVIDATEFDAVERLVSDYLEHGADLLDRRQSAGLVRDGHGDLTAQDIFILPDGPRILDCLAFSHDLRVSDVLADIAFLVMDVHRLAGSVHGAGGPGTQPTTVACSSIETTPTILQNTFGSNVPIKVTAPGVAVSLQ